MSFFFASAVTSSAKAPSSAPVLSHTAKSQFTIQSYNSSLVYTATLLSGSGTANLNTSTGVYSLSDANARFSVTAAYSSNGTQSPAAIMEVKAYTCTYYNHPYQNCTTSCYPACGPTLAGNEPYGLPCCWGWSYNGAGLCCTTGCSTVDNYTCDKDPLPLGYTDTYGEWWRTT